MSTTAQAEVLDISGLEEEEAVRYCTTTTLPVFLNPLAGIAVVDKLRRRRRRRVSGGMEDGEDPSIASSLL